MLVGTGMLSPVVLKGPYWGLPGGWGSSMGIFPAPVLPRAAQMNQVIGNMELFCAH